MNRLLIRTAVLCSVMASAATLKAQSTVSSNFNSNLDGWTAVGFDIQVGFPPTVTRVANPADIVYSATGGNPGGYARLTDAVTDPGSFASAPAKFLGNLLPYKDQGTLSFDHRLFATGTPASGIESYAAFLISGNPNNLNFLYWESPGPSGPTGWVHFDVPINQTTWSRSPFAILSFDQILSNVTEMLLPFELVDNDGTQNQEHGGIDNVVLAATGLPGDHNRNGAVNAADYVAWRKNPSAYGGDPGGYNTWRTNFGRTASAAAAGMSSSAAVPEPASVVFVCLGLTGLGATRWINPPGAGARGPRRVGSCRR
jgi:hypothetical protein